jgi:hypothetical protein
VYRNCAFAVHDLLDDAEQVEGRAGTNRSMRVTVTVAGGAPEREQDFLDLFAASAP